MFKLTIIAALVAASFSSAQAQIVTSKCGCTIQKWIYSRTDTTETLENPDANTWVELDWKNGVAHIKGGDTYPLKGQASAFEPKTTAWYGGQTLTIYYDERSRYIGHEVKN